MQPEWRDTDWTSIEVQRDVPAQPQSLVFPDPQVQPGSNAHVLDQEGSMVTRARTGLFLGQ